MTRGRRRRGGWLLVDGSWVHVRGDVDDPAVVALVEQLARALTAYGAQLAEQQQRLADQGQADGAEAEAEADQGARDG